MARIILFFILVALAAVGFAWLADQPGMVGLSVPGYQIEMSLTRAVIVFAIFIIAILVTWSLVRRLLIAPRTIANRLRTRRREKGIDALNKGLVAVSGGDAAQARKYAIVAKRNMGDEPMAKALHAQAAQLAGDRAKARHIYNAMLESPESEIMGLRGLYFEARKEKEAEAARQYAQRAVKINPRLKWAVQGLLELQSRSGEWAEARETLKLAKLNGQLDKNTAKRHEAVLFTAQAMEIEDDDMDQAVSLALAAHKLAPDLVPAANVAGRILASQGNPSKAAKIIAQTWERAPHPDLALTFAHARTGDAARDRLRRVKQLAQRRPHNVESPIAVAVAAIEALDWQEARAALKPLLNKRPSQRVCTLMARIEGGEFGDKGRVREWLARAVRAPRDPVWTADGYVSEHWMPVSPISGELDAFQWKVPVEQLGHVAEELPFEEFIPLKADDDGLLADEAKGSEEVVAMAAIAASGPVDEAEEVGGGPATADVTVAAGAAAAGVAGGTNSTSSEADAEQEGARSDETSAIKATAGAATAMTTNEHASDPKQASTTDEPVISKEQDIYVPPHAPDDPGPGGAKEEDEPARGPYRYRFTS